MATSSIKRNFVIEGKDAEDFANSLDNAITERDTRKKNIKKIEYREVTDKEEIKMYLSGLIK